MWSRQIRELRECTVTGQMVQSLRSPQVDGREQLMTTSGLAAMVGGHPLAHLWSESQPCHILAV